METSKNFQLLKIKLWFCFVGMSKTAKANLFINNVHLTHLTHSKRTRYLYLSVNRSLIDQSFAKCIH